jgi:hypothetical protein
MWRREDRDDRYDGAIQTRPGEGLRAQHDLMEPLAPRLLDLLAQLETRVRARETQYAKLYAEVDECVSALLRAANRKQRDPREE